MKGIPDHPKVYSRSFGMEGTAVAATDDGRFLVEFDKMTAIWLPREDLEEVKIMARKEDIVLFLEDGTDVNPAQIEKLENGDVAIHATVDGQAKILPLGGGIGLRRLGTEPGVYTLLGVVMNDNIWTE